MISHEGTKTRRKDKNNMIKLIKNKINKTLSLWVVVAEPYEKL